MAQVAAFGQSGAGAMVHRLSLRSESLAISVLTLGATLQSVRLAGVAHDLTLGSDSLADYEGAMCYHGAIIAPVVNRITGAQATIAGKPARFAANFLGRHCLHSGPTGTQHQIWQIADHGDDFILLSLHLADGLGGFPGTREARARFTLRGARLRLDISALSDAPTLWNAANHSYWNLDGSPDFAGHRLEVAADHYLPTDKALIPTGQVAAVVGTDMDFRAARALHPGAPALDNSFCLGRTQGALREVLVLQGASGVTLRLATTEPAVQLYDCRHDGYAGLAIEAQNWPDAPSQPDFPSIALAAGQTLVQSTQWQFSKGLDDNGVFPAG